MVCSLLCHSDDVSLTTYRRQCIAWVYADTLYGAGILTLLSFGSNVVFTLYLFNISVAQLFKYFPILSFHWLLICTVIMIYPIYGKHPEILLLNANLSIS